MEHKYDYMSREDLINEIERLRKRRRIDIPLERKDLLEREKVIKAERPGTKWRWSDERLCEIHHKLMELQHERDLIQLSIDCINRELEYIKRAENGGCKRDDLDPFYYDDEMYLDELNNFGHCFGKRL